MTFCKRLGIGCASSFNVSRVTFFHAKRSRLFSSFIVLGAGSLYVVSSMILQMFSMGLRSREFAGQPSLAIKFGKFFWHHVWVAFEVWAGAPSWTNVFSFLELNSFLSIGPPVTWRLDANGFTSFSRIWLMQYSEVRVWPVSSMCNFKNIEGPQPVWNIVNIFFRSDLWLKRLKNYYEESAISNSSVPQKIWKRYVDDSFCIIGKDDVSAFHGSLNSIDKNISFTIETECNGKISFLDTLVSRKNGVIAVDVYRKPTHTDKYLDFNSHHDNLHKANTASTLLHRALNLSNSSEGIKRELNHVHAALESNGYPSKFIKNL